jgi:hypothetical protein
MDWQNCEFSPASIHFDWAKHCMVDFDLLIEIPLDTDSLLAFFARCIHSIPRALLLTLRVGWPGP